jgi:hypothetical protein
MANKLALDVKDTYIIHTFVFKILLREDDITVVGLVEFVDVAEGIKTAYRRPLIIIANIHRSDIVFCV